ncbi:MAG: hypothetical protein M3419_06370 [Actinomycetota bacterium]|nr:hypothetical protein [Actinomycetota bacterium]
MTGAMGVAARMLLSAVLSAAVLVPTTANANPAQSGDASDDCVTRAEYRAAKHGMTKRRVHDIFGTRGTRIYLIAGNEERRAYRMCDPSLRLTVVYLRGRLGYKQLRDA